MRFTMRVALLSVADGEKIRAACNLVKQCATNYLMSDKQISARVPEALAQRLSAATDRAKDPYAPTVSQVINRGIELALKELEAKRKK